MKSIKKLKRPLKALTFYGAIFFFIVWLEAHLGTRAVDVFVNGLVVWVIIAGGLWCFYYYFSTKEEEEILNKIKKFGELAEKSVNQGLTKKEYKKFRKLEDFIPDAMCNCEDKMLFNACVEAWKEAVKPLRQKSE